MNNRAPITVPGVPLTLSWSVPPLGWELSPEGALSVTAGPRTDLFIDPGEAAEPSPVLSAPRLLGRLEGDFQLSARVSVDFRTTFDAGVLVVWADDETWAKLCFEYSPQGDPMIVSVVTRGLSDDCNSFVVGASQVWLRISRLGPTYAFHASTDGVTWRFVRYFVLGGRTDPRLGFEAQSPIGDSCSVIFDQVTFTTERLDNLRDGT
jgi:regulation of enolase protein 1 (concanavalin A-like superfamily)